MCLNHLIHGGSFALPDANNHYAPDLRLMPIHMDIDISVDLAACAADGAVIHTIEAQSPTNMTLKLDAIDLVILKVVDLDDHDILWDYDGEVISIQWKKAFHKSEQRRVCIQYQVSNPVAGMMFSGPREIGQWMATDHETQRARYWLPCIDHSNVRTPIQVAVTHKSELTCLGPGEKLSANEISKGFTQTIWYVAQACPSYLLCIVVGDLTEWKGEPFNGKPLAAYAPRPTSVDTLERCFKPTHDLLKMLTSKLGPLPWAKYYQFAVPGIGGAMENISLVSWDEFWMFDQVMHDDWGYLFDQINLHEMAHTWFGNLVVCRDYAHSWLKESWATYMEVVWFEEAYGTDDMHYELLNKRQLYFDEVKNSYSRPIVTRRFDSPWSMYDRHLYPGGAVRIHMLREKLGDDVFWSAVRKYISKYAEQTVETDDFRRTLEEHSGQSLAEFFEQWLYRAGHPKLSIDFKHHLNKQFGHFNIRQTLVGGKDKDELFSFPLDILIQDAEDKWSRHTININSDHHMLRVDLEKSPKQIIIDPDCVTVVSFDFKPGQTILKETLFNSPNIHGRIQSAKALLRSGKRSEILAVRTAYLNESHWGVKCEIATQLGKIKSPLANDLLTELLTNETDSRVLNALTLACGNHQSEAMRNQIIKLLQRGNLPYRSRRNLLIALAKQRVDSDFETLKEAALDNGWWQYVRTGAYTAMGECDSDDVYAYLMQASIDSSNSPQARAAATRSLGKTAEKLMTHPKKRVLEHLSKLLFDDQKRVKMAALNAVTELQSQQSLPALNNVSAHHAKQDIPKIQRAIQACKTPQNMASAKKLKKKLDKMDAQITKLRARVLELETQIDGLPS